MNRLGVTTQQRIAKKLLFYVHQPDPLEYAVKMADSDLDGQYRFRIGDYRIIFDVHRRKLIILKVQHRRDIYQR